VHNPALVCTGCGLREVITEVRQRCPQCAEPVEVQGDVAGARPRPEASTLLERYGAFLPFARVGPELSLGEGDTPLVLARHLSSLLRLDELCFKLEGHNPTGSFKDRGTVAGIQRAMDLGMRRVGTVSTGNMAGSVAAYAARAGLPCVVAVSPDTPDAKLGSIAIHGPSLLRLTDDYADAYRTSVRIGPAAGVYFINSDDPFRVEGQKTLAYEIMEQSGERSPELIVLPVSSGGNASALLKGLDEWRFAGLADELPRLLCVQAVGCAPIASAFAAAELRPRWVDRPDTIAHAISNPSPPSGARLLRALGAGERGWAIAVRDREIEAAQRLLAEEEGLFVQPDAAAALAGLSQALRNGSIPRPSRVTVVLTGHGLKDPAAVERLWIAPRSISAAQLESALSERA